jgi:hypothetical protein
MRYTLTKDTTNKYYIIYDNQDNLCIASRSIEHGLDMEILLEEASDSTGVAIPLNQLKEEI